MSYIIYWQKMKKINFYEKKDCDNERANDENIWCCITEVERNEIEI